MSFCSTFQICPQEPLTEVSLTVCLIPFAIAALWSRSTAMYAVLVEPAAVAQGGTDQEIEFKQFQIDATPDVESLQRSASPEDRPTTTLQVLCLLNAFAGAFLSLETYQEPRATASMVADIWRTSLWALAAALHMPARAAGWQLRPWIVLQAIVCLGHTIRPLADAYVGPQHLSITLLAAHSLSATGSAAALLAALFLRRRSSSSSFDPTKSAESEAGYGQLPEYTSHATDRLSEESGASLWQKLTLSWLHPMLRAGNKAPLQAHTLYSLPETEEPATAAARAREEWSTMMAEPEKANLWMLLWRLYGTLFCGSGLCIFIGELLAHY